MQYYMKERYLIKTSNIKISFKKKSNKKLSLSLFQAHNLDGMGTRRAILSNWV